MLMSIYIWKFEGRTTSYGVNKWFKSNTYKGATSIIGAFFNKTTSDNKMIVRIALWYELNVEESRNEKKICMCGWDAHPEIDVWSHMKEKNRIRNKRKLQVAPIEEKNKIAWEDL